MKTFKQLRQEIDEACWKGYKQVGGKMKNGKMVPNCVPTKEETSKESEHTNCGTPECCGECGTSKPKQIDERGADSKGYFRSTESGAGLTPKGAKHYGIKTAVTTPPSKLKPGSKAAKRRKSFCARMSGMPGPMKDEKGRPTRKAASLRRWNCNE
jgi:hypothetical protein